MLNPVPDLIRDRFSISPHVILNPSHVMLNHALSLTRDRFSISSLIPLRHAQPARPIRSDLKAHLPGPLLTLIQPHNFRSPRATLRACTASVV